MASLQFAKVLHMLLFIPSTDPTKDKETTEHKLFWSWLSISYSTLVLQSSLMFFLATNTGSRNSWEALEKHKISIETTPIGPKTQTHSQYKHTIWFNWVFMLSKLHKALRSEEKHTEKFTNFYFTISLLKPLLSFLFSATCFQWELSSFSFMIAAMQLQTWSESTLKLNSEQQ